MADSEPIEFHAIAVEAVLLLSLAPEQRLSATDLVHLRTSLEALLETDELAIAVESLVRLAAHLDERGLALAAQELIEVAALAAPTLVQRREARADADRLGEVRFERFCGERRERLQPQPRARGAIALHLLAPRKTIR